MAKIKTILEVPDGNYCIREIPINKTEQCIMLDYGYNYCRLFKERLKLDWETDYPGKVYFCTSPIDGLFLSPIKSPQCITAEIEK